MRSVFLLFLNERTFADHDESAALEAEVRDVMSHRRAELLLVHWTEVPFERFFKVTPHDLLLRGLYKSLAVPFFPPGPQQPVSMATVALALGASRTGRRKAHDFSREHQLSGAAWLDGALERALEESSLWLDAVTPRRTLEASEDSSLAVTTDTPQGQVASLQSESQVKSYLLRAKPIRVIATAASHADHKIKCVSAHLRGQSAGEKPQLQTATRATAVPVVDARSASALVAIDVSIA